MIDPKPIAELDVLLSREKVATLTRTRDGSTFQYTREHLDSGKGDIALHLPHGLGVSGTTNLPSFFAGLLPEGVMQDAIVRACRLSRDDLFSQLAVAGWDAIGDITVTVPGQPIPSAPRTSKEAVAILSELRTSGILRAAPSVSGAQPKLSIGAAMASNRGKAAIVKVEPEAYPGLIQNEAFFMQYARAAGLRAARVRLEGEGLVIDRFDRIREAGNDARQIHVEDALQVLNSYPLSKYSWDYLEIMDVAVRLGVAKSVLLDLLKLYAYSYVIFNGDLHAKNVSFMFDRESGKWTLTPAYDLVCTLPYFLNFDTGRRMALGLDDQFGAFTANDFRRAGERYRIPGRAVESMLTQISRACFGIRSKRPPVADSICDEIVARALSIDP